MNSQKNVSERWQFGSSLSSTFALTGMLISMGSLAHAEAIQWTEAEGGNGHWYERTYEAGEITWHQARDIAQARGGDSVVFNTLDERVWINDQFVDGQPYCAPADWAQRYTFWVGLYQDLNAPDYSEPAGGWYWIDGTSLEDTPVCTAPYYCAFSNGGTGPEAFGVMGDGGIGWIQDEAVDADIYCVKSALIEWSADCNDDGIVDYGQILDGTYADNDGNGVPDCCDAGEPCSATATNHVLELLQWPDAAVIPHHSSITPLDAMTIEFWVQADGPWGRAITKRPGNGGCYTVEANHDDVGCDAHVSIFGSCLSGGWNEIPCSWTHLAVTVDGASGTTRNYENGVLVYEDVLGSECTIGQGSWDLRFGNTNGYSSTQFIGRLDNIRIWNAPLSEDDIRHWMVTDITPEIAATLPDLGGSWNFEDGVADATGINNGWLEGGAVLVEDQSIFMDCNGNMIPDSQDIADGTSTDYNTNDVPDECECLADLDQDGEVAVSDLLTVIAQWGNDDSGLGDINHDGTVGVHDVLYALNSWGVCP